MAAADVVITGTVLTVDDARPTAEALAIADGRIVAVGDRAEVAAFIGPDTQTIDVGDGCVMPGFVEAHGHPLMEAIALSDRLVDIRPVTMRDADEVVDAVRREVARRGPDGAYLNGWDPLLQDGLPEPTLSWLDEIAPDDPLVIIHNSGHKAYFNSRAAQRAGLTRDTADPKGAKYGRDANGDLDGTAEETGAVFPLLNGAIAPSDYPAMLLAECARLNQAGLTTCSEMAFDPALRPLVEQLRGKLIGTAAHLRDLQPADDDRRHPRRGRRHAASGRHQDLGGRLAVDRQHRAVVPYLDTAATRTIGVTPGSCGCANYTAEQLHRDRRRLLSRWAGRWPATCRATPASTPSSTSTRKRCNAIRATTIGCASSTSARSGPSSSSGPPTSASPAASSSTRSTTGVTSSSTGCSARSADPVGCQQVPRWPPACASRCTTIRR